MTLSIRAALVFTVLTSSLALARPALAQQGPLSAATLTQVQLSLPVQTYSLARPEVKAADQIGVSMAPKIVDRRPSSAAWKSTLAALDVMTVSAQLADFDSTLKVMKVGGIESNPLMSGLVSNRNAFLGAKLGIAAGLVYATHSLAHHNKIAAVVASVAANSAYAYISQRNYRLAKSAPVLAR